MLNYVILLFNHVMSYIRFEIVEDEEDIIL